MPAGLGRINAQEILLLEQLDRLERIRFGRVVLHLHLSQLQAQHRRAQYMRIATNTFRDQVKALDGQLFTLSNDDIVFIASGVRLTVLQDIVNRMRLLFTEDPLTHYADNDQQHPQFCSWYQLDIDFAAFQKTVRELYDQSEQQRLSAEQDETALFRVKGAQQMTPAILAKLEEALTNADLQTVVRTQTACTVLPDHAPQPLFDEYYVSIGELQKNMTPGIDLLGNRWLFHHLTHLLDRRMIAHLLKGGLRPDRPFSLNLNVATLLGTDFQRFDEMVATQLRGRLVAELQAADIFADMGSFLFVRDYLRERGYRLLLDGLTHTTLNYFNRAQLGFDLIKLQWTPESMLELKTDALLRLREKIAEIGQARVVMSRVEDMAALETGRGLGIVMYQGRHIDKMLAEQRHNNRPRF